jgi:hypothetical protein
MMSQLTPLDWGKVGEILANSGNQALSLINNLVFLTRFRGRGFADSILYDVAAAQVRPPIFLVGL